MKVLSFLYFLLLKLRYSFDISGFDNIDSKKQYVVFPNHQALVDPQIVMSLVGQRLSLSPVISETYYNIPVLKQFFQMLGAVSMGDIQRGTSGSDDVKKALASIQNGVKEGKNILLYPAGQLYSQGYEVIKGKKAAFELVESLPENVEILVVRTTGLWGSMWSKAWEGNTPNVIKTILKSLGIILGNILFLVPKRKVAIKIENMTQKLKNIHDINTFNQTLEDFYNENGKEEPNYKKHFFYYNNTSSKVLPKVVGSVENSSTIIDEKSIPENVKEKIITKIAEMKGFNPLVINDIPLNEGEPNQVPLNKGMVDRPGDCISLSSNLILDLYFDSLDAAEIKSFVQINFEKASNPPITDLKSVGDLCMMAIGKSASNEALKACDWRKVENKETTIFEIIEENRKKLGEHTSIVSLFKEAFRNNKSDSFVYDTIFGLQSKKDFVIKAFLIASYLKSFEGKYIGIMLPSVSSASLIIISTYLAGKVPVMLNWTVGETALLHCVQFAKVSHILTSKNFYDKVKNSGSEKLSDKYVYLEEMLKDIPLTKKISALIASYFFPIPKTNYEDEAVLLFTSGSESLPKAVSLSHKNLISDILGAIYHFPIAKKDILMGFLPPFHSFGFTINTIMPLISGLRVTYTPDPNDAKTLANLIEHTQVTAVTATPTFLKMILSVATEQNLKTLSYAVVGAEKCPETLAENFGKYCPNGKILEGYGITECSPVISINPPFKPKLGSVGLPVYGSDVKIVSLADQSFLGSNEEGMIYFSGDNVFAGYLDEKLESPFETFNPPVINDISLSKGDSKRYYKTGDLGYLDADGYLYITGRLKRFVKIAGEMISLPFIEGILSKKYGSDTELKIAIEALENNGNVKIVLFSTEALSLDEVSNYLRSSGSSNLVKISEIMVIPTIPVLGTGKTDYKELKKMIHL